MTGNRRTKSSYIEHALLLKVGDPFDGDLSVLEQRLFNLRIFKNVHVVSRVAPDGGVDLEIAVEERWTLLPIPMFTASGGEVKGGVLLFESNFLGMGKQAILGGMLSTEGASGFASYRDPAVAGSRWLFASMFAYQDTRPERYQGGVRIDMFSERRYELSIQGGRQLTDAIAVNVGWFEQHVDVAAESGYAAPEPSAPTRGPLVAIEVKRADYHLFYSEGVTAKLQYREAFSWLGSERALQRGEASVSWGHGNEWGHTWSLMADLKGIRGDAEVDAFRLGGRPGSRGFQLGGLWAEQAATAAFDYQIPVWRPSWGVMTCLGLLDAGLIRWRGADTQYVAPGLGVRFYLRDIALPALGVDLAMASTEEKPVVSVSAGFQF